MTNATVIFSDASQQNESWLLIETVKVYVLFKRHLL